jgi:hypothetical protein
MPDSQLPPIWGPAYDERDLDALLSGRTGSTPAALQPVESTLAALRAPATRRELGDEAAARAAFRALAPLTPAPPPWTAGPEHAAVTAHTLVLTPADGRRQPAARHRHRRPRPAARGARKPGIAVTGVAAAALIAVAAVVTGALTGSIGELTSFGRQPASASASAGATAQPSGSQGVLAKGAAPARTPSPQTTVAAPATPRPTSGPGSLCREYFEFFEYSGHPTSGGVAAWIALGAELGKLAGGPLKIYGYCLRYLDNPLTDKSGWPMVGTDTGALGASGRGDHGTGSPGPASINTASRGEQGGTGDQDSGTADQGLGNDPGAGVGGP